MKERSSFREIRYNKKFQKILDVAARLFAKKGYEKVSIEEIASKLDLTKGSLYHYFKGKDELLFHIQLQAIDNANQAILKVLDSDAGPMEKLKEAVRAHVRVVTKREVIGALRQQELILPPKWRAKYIEARSGYDNNFRKIIREGAEAGLFGAKHWKLSSFATLGALNWIIMWYSPRGELSVEEIADAMVDFITKAFAPEKDKA